MCRESKSRADELRSRDNCAFFYDPTLTQREKIQYTILAPLAFVRFVLVILTVVLCGIYCYSISWTPQSWKPYLMKPASWFARLFLFVIGFYYIPVHRSGAGRSPAAPVIVCNHTTYLDAVVLLWEMAPAFIAKDGVLHVPVVGAICRALGVIGVKRERGSAGGTRDRMSRHALQFPGVPPMLVFPEGTTSRENTLIKFKTGAFSIGVPVQPVLLIWHKRSFDICNVVGTPLKTWMLRAFGQIYHKASVHYLNVCTPSEEELDNPLLFTLRVRQYMFSEMQALEQGLSTNKISSTKFVLSDLTTTDFFVWKDLIEIRNPPVPINGILGYSLEHMQSRVTDLLCILHGTTGEGSQAIADCVRDSIGQVQLQATATTYAEIWQQTCGDEGTVDATSFGSSFKISTAPGTELLERMFQAFLAPVRGNQSSGTDSSSEAISLIDFAVCLVVLSPAWCIYVEGFSNGVIKSELLLKYHTDFCDAWNAWYGQGQLEMSLVTKEIQAQFVSPGSFFISSQHLPEHKEGAPVSQSNVLLQEEDAEEDSMMDVS